MHFDVEVADIDAEVERLVGPGATRVSQAPCSEHGSTWVLVHDPDGNEFCVCDGGRPD
jgi:predicted enzyme related to lactoylglutathione lyase